MKRIGNLWPQVIDIENLYQAARQAQRGKRFKPSVLAFNHHLEDELYQLQEELDQFTYQPGSYTTFRIFDPKPRLISAAPYRDRVVHHALALFADDWEYLSDCRQRIEAYLATLRVKIHPIKSQLFETRAGANFVGFRVLGDRVRVRNDNLRRARKRLRKMQEDFGYYRLSANDVIHHLSSWDAHLKHGNTYRLRRKIFDDLWFRRYVDPPRTTLWCA